jgi:flagellar hook-associated protein 2
VATISSPGIGSTLDVKTIVSQLMTVESQPLTLLANKESSYTAKLTSFGLVKSTLSSLQIAAQKLNLSSTYSSVTPSVADSSVLSASVSGTTPAGSYNIEVQHLAQAQKLISSGYATTDTAVGKGTLTISLGAYSDSSSPPVSFTQKTGSTPISITIDSSNNTLEGIRDAINDSDAGVTATIVNDGTSYRLSLSSQATGEQNAVKIAVTENGAAGLGQLAYDGSTGGVSALTQNVAPQDAVIKVDGLTITKQSNTITDAIQGVTLNLTKETGSGVTTKLTLARDTASIRTALQGFVDAYNAVNKQIATSSAYDSATNTASPLTGDATLRTIQTQLRSNITNPIPGAPAGLATLTDIGIGFQTDGTLAIDSSKLDKVLADPTIDLSKMFTKSSDGTIGYGSRINSLVSGMIFGDDSIVNGRIDGLNTSIKDIGNQRDQENVRLAAIEKRYNAQFSALDTLIASMTSTSTYLTQQLAALSAQTSS